MNSSSSSNNATPVTNWIGDTFYYDTEGYLHRTDGPAISGAGGDFWFMRGKLHSVEGPAKVYSDGLTQFYIDNHLYTFEEWCKKLHKTPAEVIMLRLKYNILD